MLCFNITIRVNWNKGDTHHKEEEGEVMLSLFQGTCYSCGKTGYRASQCPKNNKKERKDKSVKLSSVITAVEWVK